MVKGEFSKTLTKKFARRILFTNMPGDFIEVVPIIGVELMTYRLQGGCSTN